MNDVIQKIYDIGIVPVIAIDDADKAVPLAKALVKGGLPAAEVTFRTAAAEEAIKRIVAEVPEMLVGAGTVLTKEQAEYVDSYFEENIYPVLTPMAMDSARPFPLIRNKTLNIGALVQKKEDSLLSRAEDKKEKKGKEKEKEKELEFATVQVPSVLPRFILLPQDEKTGQRYVILLEEIIERNMQQLFLSYDIVCPSPYREMRNADLTIEEDEAADLLIGGLILPSDIQIIFNVVKQSFGKRISVRHYDLVTVTT